MLVQQFTIVPTKMRWQNIGYSVVRYFKLLVSSGHVICSVERKYMILKHNYMTSSSWCQLVLIVLEGTFCPSKSWRTTFWIPLKDWKQDVPGSSRSRSGLGKGVKAYKFISCDLIFVIFWHGYWYCNEILLILDTPCQS